MWQWFAILYIGRTDGHCSDSCSFSGIKHIPAEVSTVELGKKKKKNQIVGRYVYMWHPKMLSVDEQNTQR